MADANKPAQSEEYTADDTIVADGTVETLTEAPSGLELEHDDTGDSDAAHDDTDEDHKEANGKTDEAKPKDNDEKDEDQPEDGSDTEKEHTSDEEEDSDDDSDDDEIPLLKYSRPTSIKLSDISTCAFHLNYIIFATHLGMVLIYTPQLTLIRTYRAHRALVLLVYTDGQYFATGSMDGTVVIGLISDDKDISGYDFQRPIHRVVLDRNYAATRGFITGGMSGKVLYLTKNWLGKRADVVLDEGQGPIVGIEAVGEVLFWMNDAGITAFHTTTRRKIATFDRPADAPRLDEYWPRCAFPDADRVVVGWGNYVWLLRVLAAPPAASTALYLPLSVLFRTQAPDDKKVELEHMYKMESLIAGIVPFRDDQWLVLTYPWPQDMPTGRAPVSPDLQVVNSVLGAVEWEEEIGMRDGGNLGLNDHRLCVLDDSYFIVLARDLVVARPFHLDDRLQWWVDHDRFDEAWLVAKALNMPLLKRLNYGIRHVDNLVKDDNWDEALGFLAKVLAVDEQKLIVRDDKSTIALTAPATDDAFVGEVVHQWEEWLSLALLAGQFQALTAVIPKTPKLAINRLVYTQILGCWLENDPTTFAELVHKWDPELYDVLKVEASLEEVVEGASDAPTPKNGGKNASTTPESSQEPAINALRRALAHLYVTLGDPAKAVPHLMHIHDSELVAFICKHTLVQQFFSDIPTMLSYKFDSENALTTLPVPEIVEGVAGDMKLLVGFRHEVSPQRFIDLFNRHNLSVLTYAYLEQLEAIDDFAASKFGNEMVRQLVEYLRPKLLPYLSKHDTNYDIDLVIDLCQRADYVPELVYLKGKIGDNRLAMELILNRLDDPDEALDFARRQHDRDAWQVLLDYAVADVDGGRPQYIKTLIEGADDKTSEFYDPLTLLKRMPASIVVNGLNQSVVKFTKNNALNLVLHQLIVNILYKQAETASRTYKHIMVAGVDASDSPLDLEKYVGVGVSRTAPPTTALYQLEPLPYGTVPAFQNLATKLALLSREI